MLVYNTAASVDNNEAISSTFSELRYTKAGNISKVIPKPADVEDSDGGFLGFEIEILPTGSWAGVLFEDLLPSGSTISPPFNVSFWIRKVGTSGLNDIDVRVSNTTNTWFLNRSVSTSWSRIDITMTAGGTTSNPKILLATTAATAATTIYQISNFQISSGSAVKTFTSEPPNFGKGVYRWSADKQRWHVPGLANDDAWGVRGEDRINIASRIGKTGIGLFDPEVQLHVREGENHGGVWFEVPSNGGGANLVIGDTIPYDRGPELLIKTNNPNLKIYDNNGFSRLTGILYEEKLPVSGRRYVFTLSSDHSNVFTHVAYGNHKVATATTGYGHKWYTNRTGLPYSGLNTAPTGTGIMSLAQTGDLTIAGTLTQSSDERLKKNFRSIESPLESLSLINGYYYEWKDAARGTATQIGFKAQEVEKVFPELVSEGLEGYKGINYIGMIPILVEAVKDLKVETDQLIKRTEALERTR